MAEWQLRLGLMDWDITIKYVRHFDLDQYTVGTCKWHMKTKEAKIKILVPEDFPETIAYRENDIEMTIVHELLHLHISPIVESDTNTFRETIEEQVIHKISKALVNAKRGLVV